MLLRGFKTSETEHLAEMMLACRQEWGITGELVSDMAERLLVPNKHTWVAMDNHEIVGLVSWQPELDSSSPSNQANQADAHLNVLYVIETHRGAGLAELLHNKALTLASIQGYQRIRLWRPEAALAAQKFYLRNGYHETGVTETFSGMKMFELRRTI